MLRGLLFTVYNFSMNMKSILYSLPGIILGLTLHEYCHAFASHKLGDETAEKMGRLSFNPLRHIDLIGLLFIIFAGFGWARPVIFNPENLKHPRRDKAIIAGSGPLANLVLALIFIAFIRLWLVFPALFASSGRAKFVSSVLYSDPFVGFMTVIYSGIMINLGLFFFNLLPIPPLDGSHIVFSGLNLSHETELLIMKIGTPLLFIILIIQNRAHITIIPIGKLISAVMSILLPMPG